MATSVRDLLHALEQEAPYAAGAARQVEDNAWSLAELGRALRLLSGDGLDLAVGGGREELVTDLAESCTQIARPVPRTRNGRLTDLAGAVADVVVILRNRTGRDERWAVALEIAGVIQVITTYAAEGDHRRTADLAWAHLTARALVNRAAEDAPRPASDAILDRAVPRSMLPPENTPAQAARESMAAIADRLSRAADGDGRRLTLLEVFAVTRAAESTIRYGTAARAALEGQPIPDALSAAAIWYEVRDRLRPFTHAAPLKLDDRDLGVWAQRAHGELRREFGLVDRVDITGGIPGGLRVEALRHLLATVNEVPAVADYLARAVDELADRGELQALAKQLPFREERITEYLTNRPVVADRRDLDIVVARLRDAATLAAETALELNRATADTIGRAPSDQPGLLAALEARVMPVSREPATSLASNMTEETVAEDSAADAADLRLSSPNEDLAEGVGWNRE